MWKIYEEQLWRVVFPKKNALTRESNILANELSVGILGICHQIWRLILSDFEQINLLLIPLEIIRKP